MTTVNMRSPVPGEFSENPTATGKTHGKSLSIVELEELFGCKKSTIYNRINRSSKHYSEDFPKPTHEGRLARWSEVEAEAYLVKRLLKRDSASSKTPEQQSRPEPTKK